MRNTIWNTRLENRVKGRRDGRGYTYIQAYIEGMQRCYRLGGCSDEANIWRQTHDLRTDPDAMRRHGRDFSRSRDRAMLTWHHLSLLLRWLAHRRPRQAADVAPALSHPTLAFFSTHTHTYFFCSPPHPSIVDKTTLNTYIRFSPPQPQAHTRFLNSQNPSTHSTNTHGKDAYIRFIRPCHSSIPSGPVKGSARATTETAGGYI